MKPVLGLLCIVLLASCSAPSGQFRVAVDPHRPPLAFLDPQGRPAGYEIDLVKALAREEGWDLELVVTTTDGLIRGAEGSGILGGLDRGDWDLVVSSVEHSNLLLDRWSLSRPYLNTGPVVVVRTQDPVPALDAAWPGLVGVVEGTPGSSEVRKSRVPTWRVRRYFDPASALEDLADGNLTAAVVGTGDVASALFDNEGLQAKLRFGGPPLTQDRALVAVSRRNDPRLAAVNRGLAALEQNGAAAALRRQWFLEP